MLVPRTEPAAERFSQAAALLPWELRQGAERLTEGDKSRAEELRLRAGRPPTAVLPEGEITLPGCGDRSVTGEDLRTVLEVATQASAHAVLDRVRDIPETEVRGPAPHPVLRVNNRFRYRLTVVSKAEKALRAALSDAMRDIARQGQHRGVSCFADCNPMDG